ncbi:accessory gene regulator B family protein [Paenibacillus sedimenti]|uniref:Accessory gene regulator B family protein n=1 Tax=Paenibacillus sedimenti TaxID=2770274 RepID=A0A926KL60_9BACL|nr:accessory gene regulator B family protein [Paenibacillus sedimenti]MBD0379680.1 accessory gene regulator B family protein [Paenibacillus sedimenti]
MLVNDIAEKIAISIHNNSTQPSSSVNVMKHALINLLNYIIIVSIVEVICIITGDFLYSLIPLIAFPVLRYFSGGLHLKHPNACNVLTSVFMLASVYVPIEFWYAGIVLNAIALWITLLRAPTNISRFTKNQYPALKIAAACVIGINFFIQSPMLAVIFFLQALTLLKSLQKTADRYGF